MSALSDALKGIKQVLNLQLQVERLEKTSHQQAGDLRKLADGVAGLDKRLVRIETMIEMAARLSPPPQITG
jgi:hypothetical protein